MVLTEHRLERCLAAADRVIAHATAGASRTTATRASFLRVGGERSAARCRRRRRGCSRAPGLAPPPAGVKQARARCARRGLLPPQTSVRSDRPSPGAAHLAPATSHAAGAGAASMRGVWHELRDGPRDPARASTLTLRAGETVALMGRNGAGKSTLLRHAAGLLEPTRGTRAPAGRVALLLQNPGDYFLHERVADEAAPEALELRSGCGRSPSATRATCPAASASAWRSRSCSAATPAGRRARARRAHARHGPRGEGRARGVAARRAPRRGQAVIVATHDPEFAAAFATRAVLMADGRVIADGRSRRCSPAAGTSRPRPRASSAARGGALLPEQGAALLRARPRDARGVRRASAGAPRRRRRRSAGARAGLGGGAMTWQLASFALVARRARRRAGSVRAQPTAGEAWSRSWRRSPRWRRSGATRSRPLPDVKPITAIVLVSRLCVRCRVPASRSARSAVLASNILLGQGP